VNAVLVVQRAGDGGDVDAGFAGNVFNGDWHDCKRFRL
jgi:hypothetical protein